MLPLRSHRISINACPEDVFRVLTDYDNYSRWNTWLKVVHGEAAKGGYLIVKPHLATIFSPVKYQFEKVEAPALLCRTQVGWSHFFIYSKRERLIYTKADGTTLYVTHFYFGGVAAYMGKLLYGRAISNGIKEETLALKKYCERNCGIKLSGKLRRESFRRYVKSGYSQSNLDNLDLTPSFSIK